MPSIASDSCHMTSGCSGLPKLRQLTTAIGRAPTQARLSTDSATVSAVPWRGSTAHQRWLPSVVRARPRPVSTPVVGCLRRRTAASPPGPSTVLRKSWWSYCDDTHDGVVRAGRAASAAGVGRPGGAGGRAAGARPRSAGSAQRAVVERGGVVEAGGRHVGQHLAVEAVEDAQPADAVGVRLGDLADDGGQHLPPLAQPQDLVEVLGRDDGQHPLLGLRWSSPRRAPCRPRGGARRRRRRPCPRRPLAAVSLVAQVRPAPPRSWMPTTRPASSSARQASMRRFSSNGSPTWTAGRLSSLALVEAGRGQHADAADAVAAGGRAEQHGQVADAGGLAEHQPVDRAGRPRQSTLTSGLPA